MAQQPRKMIEIPVEGDQLPVADLLAGNQPAVLRGAVAQWPITQAALQSERAAAEYLRGFYNGRPTHASIGGPDLRGRLFYTEDFSALNFAVERVQLDQLLDRLISHLDDPNPPTLYVGSLLIDTHLPGLRAHNDLGLDKQGISAPPSIWIGNRTIASCHYDAPYNLACCVAGRRRFTLLPPEQIVNLYPGPLDPTPGGQAISLVDFANPDFDRHPRFREAQAHMQTVEVAPGDVVFIPSMWWHHVEGLSAFNLLVNYWWSMTPAHLPTPMQALYHALWTIRDRPDNEKRAWRNVFDYYVFGNAAAPAEHIPPAARGPLGPIDEDAARRIRAMLINKLNR